MTERWVVVRNAHLPGGVRVIQHGLTEAEARKRAAEYKRPHFAMAEAEVIARRVAAVRIEQLTLYIRLVAVLDPALDPVIAAMETE